MRKTNITDIKVKAVRNLSNPDFLEYHKNNDAFGDEWTEKFLEYVNIPLRKSIRINTLKISPDDFFKNFPYEHTQILWSWSIID